MKGERKGHSLQATELVDQIYLRLVAAKDRDWQNRAHFFAIAARAMRRHLIDHARGRPDAWLVVPGVLAFLAANLVDWEWYLPLAGAAWALALGAVVVLPVRVWPGSAVRRAG